MNTSAPSSASPSQNVNSENLGPQSTSLKSDASPLRSILALLPEVETVISCLECASAAAFDAETVIFAVHVGFDPKNALVSAEELDVQYLRDATEGAAEVRTARVKAAFDAWISNAAGAGKVRWKDDTGDITTNVVEEAGKADLVVIGRPLHLDAKDALRAALFKIRRLVLIAPRKTIPEGRIVGRHMVVGWKPGEPARHAIEAAVPWLNRAEKITVLCVAKEGVEPYAISARTLFTKLGIVAEFVTLEKDTRSVGRLLLDETIRLGGDSLVIGAYHHGQFWEAVLGGVTRDVLANAEVPVFMMR